MLTRFLKLVGIITLIAYPILFWVWQSSGFPIDVEACQHYAANGQCENSAAEHVYLFLPRKLGELLRDAAFVGAIATIAIAFFPFPLKKSTDKLFAATSASVEVATRALTELERPYVFLDRIPSSINRYVAGGMSWDPNRFSPEFFPELINHGRTPANVAFAAIFFEVGRSIPDE